MNRLMKALLDSLSQGFFIFDNTGLCLEVSSKACEETVETTPAGKKIWEVLKLPEAKVNGFQRWMTTVFSEMLPFADLSPLGPASYEHSAGKNISLEYFPLRNDENQIDGVVVVASDITNLIEAQRQAVIEKQHSEMIIHLVRNKNQVSRFLRESHEMMAELHELLKSPILNTESVFRCLHTLKGGAGMLSIFNMTESCHAAETALAAQDFDLVRSDCAAVAKSFEVFKHEAKEILGASAMSEERLLEVPASELQTLLAGFQAIPEARLLAESVLKKYIHQPVESFFAPYKEAALKLAAKQDKTLNEVKFVNGDITVVPEIYGPLFATFVHAFRNAVDHGLEPESERRQAGKPAGGEIVVQFERLSSPDRLKISVQDDGRGIDPE
jgi:two-component system chemotaxis sensor kinase CheA